MTTRHYALDAHFSFTLDENDGSIIEFLDDAVNHLEELGVEDIMVVSDEVAQTFTISQLVPSSEGESIETVVGKGMGALRTAFHACNGNTPAWPTPREALLSVEVSPVNVHADAPADRNLALI